jgi:glycosyltransferase involved in cell wall biosynthesis
MGVEIVTYMRSSDQIFENKLEQLKELVTHQFSRRSDLDTFLQSVDVLQIHNSFPLLSVADWLLIEESEKLVVRVIHNYRRTCLTGTHFRKSESCFKCHSSSSISGVIHGCYNGSSTMSLLVWQYQKMLIAIEKRLEHSGKIRYIAISKNVKEYLLSTGIEEKNITTIPNYVSPRQKNHLDGTSVLYCGRLSGEKGIFKLLDHWMSDPSLPELHVIGSIPNSISVDKWVLDPRIKFYGQLENSEVESVASRCSFAIFPTVWEEPFGKTLVESITRNQIPLVTKKGVAEELLSASPLEHFLQSDFSNLGQLVNQKFWEKSSAYTTFIENVYIQSLSLDVIANQWKSFSMYFGEKK